MKRLNGFTLAEVLIVMAILGTIAVLTLPNLSQNTKDAEIRTRLKKAYSGLNQAIMMSVATNGKGINEMDLGEIIEKGFNDVEDCTHKVDSYGFSKCKQLQDGTMFIYNPYSESSHNSNQYLAVDVNGEQGPNNSVYSEEYSKSLPDQYILTTYVNSSIVNDRVKCNTQLCKDIIKGKK